MLYLSRIGKKPWSEAISARTNAQQGTPSRALRARQGSQARPSRALRERPATLSGLGRALGGSRWLGRAQRHSQTLSGGLRRTHSRLRLRLGRAQARHGSPTPTSRANTTSQPSPTTPRANPTDEADPRAKQEADSPAAAPHLIEAE